MKLPQMDVFDVYQSILSVNYMADLSLFDSFLLKIIA